MSDPNWASPSAPTEDEKAEPLMRPSVPPAEPTPLFVYGQQPNYPIIDPGQN